MKAYPSNVGLIGRITNSLRRRWRSLVRPIVQCFERWGSNSRKMASLFYTTCSGAFSREHRAVLFGKQRFEESTVSPDSSSSLLRRNIHRLEKGLISRPRREIFALGYIDETVDVYSIAVTASGCVGDQEVCWAHDVLLQYFEVTGSHPKLELLRGRFDELESPAQRPTPERFTSRVPYARQLEDCPVSYDSLLKLAKRRRSVRWFEQKPVPRELLLQALAVATQSPSACNRQPFEFRIFDDPELLSAVAALPAGTAGYEHNFPCVIVVLGRQRYYFDERDRHLIYIDGSLATMSFVLALETLGLSSCCINWPDIDEREQVAEKILQLEPDERPVMFIAVGYPDPTGLVPYSEKRAPEQLCRFNFE